MAKGLMIPYHPRILNPKFQMIWPKNKVARALPCLAWAPPNLADRQHSATGFCFGPFAKLFLVRLIWNFGFKFLIYKENCIPIAIWIEENSEHPNVQFSHFCYITGYCTYYLYENLSFPLSIKIFAMWWRSFHIQVSSCPAGQVAVHARIVQSC